MPPKTIFITGTDTGVGKTLLTALLLEHLLQNGVDALAMKPFCSGNRRDVQLLQRIQGARLPDQEINPFFFPEPLAPLINARKLGSRISMAQVLKTIRHVQNKCGCLLVEGAGGVLAPLGEQYTALELIKRLGCDVIVVGRNRLGVLNHVLLTLQALRGTNGNSWGIQAAKRRTGPMSREIIVALMDEARPDLAALSNPRFLAETLGPDAIVQVPFLGTNASIVRAIKKNAKKEKKGLHRLLARIRCPSFF